MKKSFAGMIKPSKDNDASMRELFLHVQKMTDDLTRVIERGLGLSENLPFVTVSAQVTNNQPTELNTLAFTVRGAIPIETAGVKLVSYSVRALPKGSVEVVCNIEPTTAVLKFILVGD